MQKPVHVRAFQGAVAALATLHGKEQVIAPVLLEKIGLSVEVARIDTDKFGTFTGEHERLGTQLEAARAKANAALREVPAAAWGMASEGSFGPHPELFFLAAGFELVILVERDSGFELVGTDFTTETNFVSRDVDSLEAGLEFAEKAEFPSHGLVVTPLGQGMPLVASAEKGLVDRSTFETVLSRTLAAHGSARVQTDMRAHLNPTRMRSIARATSALAAAALSCCPGCGLCGYVAVERLQGLPCSDCAAPTSRVLADVFSCNGCGHREERRVPGPDRASPADCYDCNP